MSEHEAQARVGEVIASKYRLERVLGAGGMGAVYAATHLFTKRVVALKLMHSSLTQSAVFAERFIREAQAPSTIGHRGIVEVLDGGFGANNELYLVLEMLSGKTLGDLETPLPIPDLVDVVTQLLDALSAAHKAGFVHRDIKPDNVFLTLDAAGRRTVKLLDFGIAGFRDASGETPQLTHTGTVLGTATFMSPEQAKGDRVDHRSDLWAVGAIIYDALAGRPPFDAPTYNAVIVSIVTREHVPLAQLRPDLPHALLDVIERALRKDLTARWQTANDMIAALAAIPNLEALSGVTTKPGAQEAIAATQLARPQPARQQAPRTEPARKPQATFNPRSRTVAPPDEASSSSTMLWVGGAAAVIGLSLVVLLLLRPTRAPVVDLSAQPSATVAAIEPTTLPGTPSPTPPAPPPADAPAAPAPTPEPSVALTTEATPPGTPQKPPLNSDDLGRMLSAAQPQMQRCYQSEVTAELVKSGSVPAAVNLDVTLTVGSSGEVRDAAIVGNASETLRGCLRDHLRKIRFRTTDEAAELNFPMVFQPTVVGN